MQDQGAVKAVTTANSAKVNKPNDIDQMILMIDTTANTLVQKDSTDAVIPVTV